MAGKRTKGRVQAIIALPPVEDLGPAMRALDERQRKFVSLWLQNRGKDASACARESGYSAHLGAERVQAHRLLHSEKILRAIKEEAERTLNSMAALAILKLGDLVSSADERISQTAVDSVLDRTGFSRRTQQDVHVEHTDSRSTAELMAMVERFRLAKVEPKQIVDSTYEEVKDGELGTQGN